MYNSGLQELIGTVTTWRSRNRKGGEFDPPVFEEQKDEKHGH